MQPSGMQNFFPTGVSVTAFRNRFDALNISAEMNTIGINYYSKNKTLMRVGFQPKTWRIRSAYSTDWATQEAMPI